MIFSDDYRQEKAGENIQQIEKDTIKATALLSYALAKKIVDLAQKSGLVEWAEKNKLFARNSGSFTSREISELEKQGQDIPIPLEFKNAMEIKETAIKLASEYGKQKEEGLVANVGIYRITYNAQFPQTESLKIELKNLSQGGEILESNYRGIDYRISQQDVNNFQKYAQKLTQSQEKKSAQNLTKQKAEKNQENSVEDTTNQTNIQDNQVKNASNLTKIDINSLTNDSLTEIEEVELNDKDLQENNLELPERFFDDWNNDLEQEETDNNPTNKINNDSQKFGMVEPKTIAQSSQTSNQETTQEEQKNFLKNIPKNPNSHQTNIELENKNQKTKTDLISQFEQYLIEPKKRRGENSSPEKTQDNQDNYQEKITINRDNLPEIEIVKPENVEKLSPTLNEEKTQDNQQIDVENNTNDQQNLKLENEIQQAQSNNGTSQPQNNQINLNFNQEWKTNGGEISDLRKMVKTAEKMVYKYGKWSDKQQGFVLDNRDYRITLKPEVKLTITSKENNQAQDIIIADKSHIQYRHQVQDIEKFQQYSQDLAQEKDQEIEL